MSHMLKLLSAAVVVAGLALTAGSAAAGEGIFANNGSPAGEIIQDEIDEARDEYRAAQRRQILDADSPGEASDTPEPTTTVAPELVAAYEAALAAYQSAQTAMWQAATDGDEESLPALIAAYNEALSEWEEAGCALGPAFEHSSWGPGHWQWICAGGEPPPGIEPPSVPPTTQPPATSVPPTTQPPATSVPPTTQPPAPTVPPTTQPPATSVPPTSTQPPTTTTPAPTTTQPPATTVPPTTTVDDCDCLPPTDPEYIAAKAAYEEARKASWAFNPIWLAARDKLLDALYAADDCDWCSALTAAYDRANEEYQIVAAQGKILVDAYNKALKEWDRVRDVSKVNLP